MAKNSKREQILSYLVAMVEGLPSIKTVKRVQPNKLDDIRSYSPQQMPLVSIIGGVPVPVEHRKSRGPGKGEVDIILSDISVEFFVYFMDNETPDETLSDIMDDMWSALYSNQTLGGLALGLAITPRVRVAAWDPYVAFSLEATINYKHSTGGI